MSQFRLERLSSMYQQGLSRLLFQEVKNPEVKDVVISNVKFAPDLKLATVYFRLPNGPEYAKKAINALNKIKGFLKKEMSKEVPLKYTPDLRFYYDERLDYKEKMDALFEKIESTEHVEKS